MTEIFNQSFESEADFSDYLREHNWKKIDNGLFAEVFWHKNIRGVLKIIWTPDPAYIQYARHCLKIKSNPYVPQIYRIFKIKVGRKLIYVVHLEKLQVFCPHHARWLKKHFDESSPWDIGDRLICNENDEYEDLNKNAASLLKKISSIRKNSWKGRRNFSCDLHEENIMIRKLKSGKLIPVITDPLSTELS